MINRELLQAHMKAILENDKHGTAWYSWLFTQAPAVRTYFKGAEKMEPDQVPNSERFQKQGSRFMNKMYEFVNHCDDQAALRKEFAEFVVVHKQKYKIDDPGLYGALAQIWMSYIESSVGMNEAQKAQWSTMLGWLGEEANENLGAV